MHHIPVEPPPFFHRGPSPLARLAFFGLLSLALLFADTRYRYLENIRQVVATVLYPAQRAVLLPGEALAYVGTYFSSQRTLAGDNAGLKERLLADAPAVQGYPLLEQENARLRSLLAVEKRFHGAAVAAEVLFSGRDPFTQKLFVDKGEAAGVQPGQAVIDEIGVIGQVTRVFPYLSEVTLSPTRTMRFGEGRAQRRALGDVRRGNGRMPELRFLSPSAEIQPGDRLVTRHRRDHPAGLAVAQVVSVERETGQMFARVTCRPLAGVERSPLVLILGQAAVLTRPEEPVEADAPRKGRGKRRAN
jgi:rod shape-determining protein MreC